MSVKYPQADIQRNLRGGADAWDDGPAGIVLLDDFFGETVAEWCVYWAELQVPQGAAPTGTTITCTAGASSAVGISALTPRSLQTIVGAAGATGVTSRTNKTYNTSVGTAAAAGISAVVPTTIQA